MFYSTGALGLFSKLFATKIPSSFLLFIPGVFDGWIRTLELWTITILCYRFLKMNLRLS
jgi:hypothetical protein